MALNWFGKKCKICRTRIHKGDKTDVISLKTLDGDVQLEICMECSWFYDNSDKILNRRKYEDEV